MIPGTTSVAFLLLLSHGTLTNKGKSIASSHALNLEVQYLFRFECQWRMACLNVTPESYSSSVVEGSVLLGALRRLKKTQPDFKFTVKEDPDFGLLLESVNGVAGSEHEQTYWEILSERSGENSRLLVGIGCYRPTEDEHIVLRFRVWLQHINKSMVVSNEGEKNTFIFTFL